MTSRKSRVVVDTYEGAWEQAGDLARRRRESMRGSTRTQKRHPGDSRVYARVFREGSLTSGDPVQLLTEDEALALIGPR